MFVNENNLVFAGHALGGQSSRTVFAYLQCLCTGLWASRAVRVAILRQWLKKVGHRPLSHSGTQLISAAHVCH